jgi:hypothetical protein
MKTLHKLQKAIFIAIVVVAMSVNLDAQKIYHPVSLENGIHELNASINHLIEKCKIRFDLNNTESVSELTASVANAENELNESVDRLVNDNSKFDIDHTNSVSEETSEQVELNQLTDRLLEDIKFDLSQTNSITTMDGDEDELNQISDEQMDGVRFDVTKTISVQEDQMAVAF